MNPRLAVAALAATAGVVLLVLGAEARRGGGGDGGRVPLTISGDVEGLHPGGAVPLALRIANPHAFDIAVSSLRVEVLDPGGGCPISALSVDAPPVGSVIRRRSEATVATTIRMPATAPDACQGAEFPLRYTVTATKQN